MAGTFDLPPPTLVTSGASAVMRFAFGPQVALCVYLCPSPAACLPLPYRDDMVGLCGWRLALITHTVSGEEACSDDRPMR